tara:strand:- start:257 stop:538 length:282 start_codon:yes stop_codon:yes gene_type:complete
MNFRLTNQRFKRQSGGFRSIVSLTSTIAILLLCCSPLSAKDALVKGDLQRQRVNKLLGTIQWHKSLAQAQADARSRGKMIFWVNILGKLTGDT